MVKLLTTLFIFLFFLSSCQVKETLPSNGLISNHSPTSNKFTLQSLPSKTYVAGETISLETTFPFDITLNIASGSPRIKLTIGSTIRYATYQAGTDPKRLVFNYTIESSDNDSDGIDVNALDLNGSTLKFTVNGVSQDCDVSSLPSANLANQKVDNSFPILSAMTIGNFPRLHRFGDEIRFVLTYSEAVYVTGTPKIVVMLSSGTSIDADYSAGSGTTTLVFSFKVASNHVALSGYHSLSPLINLVDGTIKDAVGNDASLDLSPKLSGVLTSSFLYPFDGEIPFVTSVTLPDDKTYVASESLNFTLFFNRAVTVTNKPYLAVTIGSVTRQALYYSGSGTQSIDFRYTLVPGDEDLNGIAVASSITQNSGNITGTSSPTKSFFSTSTNNALIIPSTKNILANAIQPRAISISRNSDSYLSSPTSDNTWIIGQELNLTVGFNTKMFVTQTLGTPSLSLSIGAATRQATYLSGGDGQTSLIFRYTIQEGDLDSDGSIGLGPINLNGGVLTDEANTNSLLTLPSSSLQSTRIDGVRPSVSSITLPQEGTYSTIAPLTTFELAIHWSEPVLLNNVTPSLTYLSLGIGSQSVNANYVSGHNSSSFIFRYTTSLAAKNDTDGISLSSSIMGSSTLRDAAGNFVLVKTFPIMDTSRIFVDTTTPTIQSVTPSVVNGTFKAGTNLDFIVTFSEAVTLNSSASFPQITMNVGSDTKLLEATTSGTSTTHTFRYTINPGDTDNDGIELNGNIDQNGSNLVIDSGRNALNGSFTPPSTSGILVDTDAPQLSSVTPPTQKTYSHPESMDIVLSFSENVFVSGAPRIPITLSSGDAYFNYHSGSGTKDLIFRFSIASTDYDFNGLPSSVSSLDFNEGSIRDIAGNSAPTTFEALDLSSILVTFPKTDLWVKTAFTNLSSNPLITTSQNGDSSTFSCGNDFCRSFNDGDNLEITSELSNVITLFLIVHLPSFASGTHEIFGSDIKLVEDEETGLFDLHTSAMVEVDGEISGPGPLHNLDMIPGTTKLLVFHFSAPLTIPQAQLLFGNSFSGGVGEIMAITDSLSDEQKNLITEYLVDKFQ